MAALPKLLAIAFATLAVLSLSGCQTADTKVGLTTNEGPRIKESVSDPGTNR